MESARMRRVRKWVRKGDFNKVKDLEIAYLNKLLKGDFKLKKER